MPTVATHTGAAEHKSLLVHTAASALTSHGRRCHSYQCGNKDFYQHAAKSGWPVLMPHGVQVRLESGWVVATPQCLPHEPALLV